MALYRKVNTLYGYLDQYTKEPVTFDKVVLWHDGTVMTDDKCDGIIYRKGDEGEYFKRNIAGNVNASWFGFSTTNNKTQNGIALQKCIDLYSAIGGGTVEINTGEYKCTKIIIKDRVKLVGKGIGHASVYFVDPLKNKGTVLLIDGQSNDDCIQFDMNTSFNGLENISVYNDNGNSIRSVVNIPGVLYPIMQNVEISSRLHASSGVETVGLLLSANTTTTHWETLYGAYVNVIVITNENVGVHTALKLLGLSPTLRPNASRFIGGHFQGYSKSLLIDGAQPNSAPQGIAFIGTAFESYYNNQQTVEFIPTSAGFNSFKHDQDRYAIIWMHLKQANQVTFTGCYTENGNSVFTYNDGVNGVHPSFPVILIDTNASQTNIVGNTIVAGIVDRGFGTTHPNKLSFLDQNSYSTVEGEPILSTSQVVLGSNGVSGLRVREGVVLIGSNNNTSTGEALQVQGNAKIDKIINVYTENNINVLKGAGGKLILGDSNNVVTIAGEPVGLGSNMVLSVENNEVVRIQPFKFIVQEDLEANSKGSFVGTVSGADAELPNEFITKFQLDAAISSVSNTTFSNQGFDTV